MKLFSVDVLVVATAYIKAESEEAARKIADEIRGDTISADPCDEGIQVDGRPYSEIIEDSNANDITVSPAMTVYGPIDAKAIEMVGCEDQFIVEQAYPEEGEDEGA